MHSVSKLPDALSWQTRFVFLRILSSLSAVNLTQKQKWLKSQMFELNRGHLVKPEKLSGHIWSQECRLCFTVHLPCWRARCLKIQQQPEGTSVSLQTAVTRRFYCSWFSVTSKMKQRNLLKLDPHSYKAQCCLHTTSQEKSYDHYWIWALSSK